MAHRTFCGAVLLTLIATATHGAPADVPGGRDHQLVKRYEGSIILRYSANEFDEYALPIGPVQGKGDKASFPKSVHLAGRVTRITYLAPAGRSTLEVAKNYQNDLSSAGFTSLFAGAHAELGEGQYDQTFGEQKYRGLTLPSQANGVSLHNVLSHDDRFLAAKLTRPEGDAHVAVYVVALAGGLVKQLYADPVTKKTAPQSGQVLVQVDVVEARPMESRMVTVSANEMARSIAASGSVAVYGILFDTNSAELRRESTPTLAEIAKLLKDQAGLRLLVVGHTDNVGTFEFNLDLSQRRAAAVVHALTSGYSIEPKRLTAIGVSFSNPIASNNTDDGRAKNRRVQLVANESSSSAR